MKSLLKGTDSTEHSAALVTKGVSENSTCSAQTVRGGLEVQVKEKMHEIDNKGFYFRRYWELFKFSQVPTGEGEKKLNWEGTLSNYNRVRRG